MVEKTDKQQLVALFEEIWAEFADAPKLSDEEIDQIVKEARKHETGEDIDKLFDKVWEEYADAPRFSDEELDQIIKEARQFVQRKYD